MPREAFVGEINRLQQEIRYLGRAVGDAILESVEILKLRDIERAKQIIAADEDLNSWRFAIESDCLTLVATQQPVASDVRLIAAILEIATELERTGDYAKGIARITILRGQQPTINPPSRVPRMAEKAINMLQRSLRAFVTKDAEAARSIAQEDDEVDELYNRVYRELIALIVADPTTIEDVNQLLWVAHNLERAADRVTNICERVVFMVTGHMHELDSEASAFQGDNRHHNSD